MSSLTETQIFGGWVVDLLEPKAADVHIEHIATALSRQYRFNGNTRKPITNAEHSLYVSNILEGNGLEFYGLLHDAHEAFFGDISSPLKEAIKKLTGVDAKSIIAAKWDEVIFPAFGLKMPTAKDKKWIKWADEQALYYEAENLMWDCEYWGYHPAKRYKPMSEKKAYKNFMAKFTELSDKLEWI